MNVTIKDFLIKCEQIRRNLITFTEEILNEKLHFLCSDNKIKNIFKLGMSWLYVITVSSTRLKVNPHSIICLNVTELLARSRLHIWSLSDINEIRTPNHLVRKRTRIDAQYLSVLCPNAGKYGPEKLRIRTLFTQCPGNIIFLINAAIS